MILANGVMNRSYVISGGMAGFPAAVALGSLHSDAFSGTLGSYTQNGTAFSISGGNLVQSTAAGSHNEYLLLNTPSAQNTLGLHCLEEWKMSISFVAPAYNTTNFGFGMGIRATNTAEQFDNYVRIAFDTFMANGSMYFYTSQNHAAPGQVAVTGTFAPVASTTYIFEVERIKNTMWARIKSANGLTTHASYSVDNPINTNGTRAANYGKFCLWAFGGTITLDNLVITTNALKYAQVLALGDSNMHGLYAGTNAQRYVEVACGALGRTFCIQAGINAQVADMPLAWIPVLAPRLLYFNVLSNDESNGVPDATWQANFNTMMTTVNGYGYNASNTILGIPCARNTKDIAAIKTFLDASYSSYQRPDLYTTTKQPANTSLQVAYDSGDNIHMSTAGNTACATPLQTSLAAL